MAGNLEGKRIAFLVAYVGVEQVELTTPWQAVEDAGGTPVLLAPEKDEVQAMTGDVEKGDTFIPDGIAAEADSVDFTALVLPGGVANPDTLRVIPAAVEFVKSTATATWTDTEVFVCPTGGRTLITSRKPDDLDAFTNAFTEVFAAAS